MKFNLWRDRRAMICKVEQKDELIKDYDVCLPLHSLGAYFPM